MKKNPKIEAVKGVAVAALAALVAAKVIDPGLSAALTGVVVAVLGLVAAFGVKPPKRKRTADVVSITKHGGSE
jgi:VIT1/CCC1 family predicted Fe2+/Mn2+ transporter